MNAKISSFVNVRNVIIAVMAIILFFAIKKCNGNADDASNWKGKYDYQNQTIDSFKNSKGIQVIEQPVAKVADADILKKLSDEIFDLKKSNERMMKKVTTFVKTDQQATIKDEFIPFDSTETRTPAEDYFTKDSAGNNIRLVNADSVVLPPKPFTKETQWYSLKGTVFLKGVNVDSLKMKNTISWRIGEKKTGLFKRETTIQAINSSPYFENTAMNSITVKSKKTAWDKWIKPLIAFVFGGTLTLIATQ